MAVPAFLKWLDKQKVILLQGQFIIIYIDIRETKILGQTDELKISRGGGATVHLSPPLVPPLLQIIDGARHFVQATHETLMKNWGWNFNS